MEGVKRNPGVRPEYKIDESGVMVCYKACKKYMELLKNNNGQDVTNSVTNSVTKNVTNKLDNEILKLIGENNKITTNEIAQRCNVAKRTILRHIDNLKENGILEIIGKTKGSHIKIL